MTATAFGHSAGSVGRWHLVVLLVIASVVTNTSIGADAAADQPVSERRQLIGAWRLVSIQVLSPSGERDDPFYNANPGGVLIYDPSGWMSVQIAGSSRPSMDVHSVRGGKAHTAAAAQIEASVLDTYYAYAATWELDAAASKVVHHVDTSLIPDETGKSYSQAVHLRGERLVFTTQREDLGRGVRQEKVWQRLGAPSGSH